MTSVSKRQVEWRLVGDWWELISGSTVCAKKKDKLEILLCKL